MGQDYKTFRVPVEAYNEAIETKGDDETWGEFIRRCSEHPPERREYVPADAVDADPEAIAERVVKKLEGRRG